MCVCVCGVMCHSSALSLPVYNECPTPTRPPAPPYDTTSPRPLAQPRGEGHAPNWVHKKIPGCAVELNTQNCAWFGSQISVITAMRFREAMPPEPPTRGSALDPAGGLPFPRHPVSPPPNPGYATGHDIGLITHRPNSEALSTAHDPN